MLDIMHKGAEGKYKYNLKETTVGEIPMSTTFKRASIIPYYILDEVKHYALFLDTRFRQLTDCGGSVKKGEFFLDAALRELNEESLGIINLMSCKKTMYNCKCYHDHERITIFVEISKKSVDKSSLSYISKYQDKVVRYFNGEYQNLNTLENCSILWLKEREITNLCNDISHSLNTNNYMTYINTSFRNYLIKRMKEYEEPTKDPRINLGYIKKEGSNIEYDSFAIKKSQMTPYWFFKIYIEPYNEDVTELPPIWEPIKYLFKTIIDSKGSLV